VPDKIDNALAFMIESCWPWRVTTRALALAEVNYDAVWAGFPKAQLPV
jgi:homogentisate 1,2-dioxygenase